MMQKRITALLWALVVLASCGSATTTPTTAKPDTARTYFESLDLGTPEAAAEVFIDAFQRDDYMTVWLVLHPNAQFMFQQHFNLLAYDQLFDASRFEPSSLPATVVDLDRWETSDQWWFFDQLMLEAARRDALLIDLRGEVTLLESRSGPDSTTDLDAEVEEIDGTVTIRLVELADRWRVLQVIVQDGNEDVIPWSVPD